MNLISQLSVVEQIRAKKKLSQNWFSLVVLLFFPKCFGRRSPTLMSRPALNILYKALSQLELIMLHVWKAVAAKSLLDSLGSLAYPLFVHLVRLVRNLRCLGVQLDPAICRRKCVAPPTAGALYDTDIFFRLSRGRSR